MSNYNKSDLVNDVAEATGNGRADVDVVINATLAAIKAAADGGRTVRLPGFGKFETKDRAARQGRNPATGEAIEIAASRAFVFKASKADS